MSSSQGQKNPYYPLSQLSLFYILETETCYILFPLTIIYLMIASKEKLGITSKGSLIVRFEYNWMQVFKICKSDAIFLLFNRPFSLWLNSQVGLLHWTAEVPLEAQYLRFRKGSISIPS